MARTLVTPFKSSDNVTGGAMLYSAAAGSHGEKLTTAGFYVKTGGASRIDPTRILFIVSVNSSKYTTAGAISVVSGSTGSNKNDYLGGVYTTLNDLNITIPVASGYKWGGISGHVALCPFFITDAQKYLDSDDYLKFNVSSKITSKGAASLGGRVMALYIKHPGH